MIAESEEIVYIVIENKKKYVKYNGWLQSDTHFYALSLATAIFFAKAITLKLISMELKLLFYFHIFFLYFAVL